MNKYYTIGLLALLGMILFLTAPCNLPNKEHIAHFTAKTDSLSQNYFIEYSTNPLLNWLQLIVTTIIAIAGGYWTVRKFKENRESKTALEIDLPSYNIYLVGNKLYLIDFEVVFTNTSKVAIHLNRPRNPSVKYNDGEELKYSGSLVIRKLPTQFKENDVFNFETLKKLPVVAEIDLFDDHLENQAYLDSLQSKKKTKKKSNQNSIFDTYFFMEPGEKYHRNISVVLRPGIYNAEVTFVGQDLDEEFWRRRFTIEILSK